MKLFLLLLAAIVPYWTASQILTDKFGYPVCLKSNATIEKFGHSIDDPYRWLEEMDSKQTKDWLAVQNELIRKYRNKVFAKYTVVERELVYSILADSMSNYLKQKIGAYYFTISYDYLNDNSPTIKFKTQISHEWGKLLSTAQFLRDKKDVISIHWINVSFNDSITAIGLSHGGSDWTEIVLVDMKNLTLLNEKIDHTKFGIAWGTKGLFYTKYDVETGTNEISARSKQGGIFYHQLGTKVSDDKAISPPDDFEKDFRSIKKGRFLLVFESRVENGKKLGTWSYIHTDSLNQTKLRPFIMAPNLEAAQMDIFGERSGKFLVRSSYKASEGRVMLYDYSKLNQGSQLVEMFSQTSVDANYLNGKIICTYLDKGNYLCLIFDSTGNVIKNLKIPPGVSIKGFSKVYRDSITYYYINSFSMPSVTMRFNLNTLQSEIADEYAGFALSSKYTTKVVSYKSKDSTEVFMYLTYNKDLKLDGTNPVLLYAYGGFGVITEPSYNLPYGIILRRNGILAVPLIRGGGELGTDWHNAGKTRNKNNSVDDVAAAAQWLIDNKYTNAGRIALTGGSQGGWLMATTAIQYPHLFKAVVPIAGIYDMIRYIQFSNSAYVGIPEFGNPDDSLDFQTLHNISPIYHVKKNVPYPSFMVVIGSNDDRVVPTHSYKLIASLQEMVDPNIPCLLYIEEKAGHQVLNTHEGLQQMALCYTFIMDELGMDIFN